MLPWQYTQHPKPGLPRFSSWLTLGFRLTTPYLNTAPSPTCPPETMPAYLDDPYDIGACCQVRFALLLPLKMFKGVRKAPIILHLNHHILVCFSVTTWWQCCIAVHGALLIVLLQCIALLLWFFLTAGCHSNVFFQK